MVDPFQEQRALGPSDFASSSHSLLDNLDPTSSIEVMTIEVVPLPIPDSADRYQLANFGREVKGVDPGTLNPEQFREMRELLYKHDILLFRDVNLSAEQQYLLTKAFDPSSETYCHGNNKVAKQKDSILHNVLVTIPRQPQVQLVGNGTIIDHEGLAETILKHAHHRTFHKTAIPEEDDHSFTRFNRWHMDAALYGDLLTPFVTTLYAVTVPQGPHQTIRYDDGTGDELDAPLSTTAFMSGRTTFELLSQDLKSVAVRARVQYAPHPYVWMATARAMSNGLGLECEDKEMPLDKLPPWDEAKIQTLPMLWKNPVTGILHFQVHPCAAQALIIDPLPAAATKCKGTLYPEGAHVTDLKEVRRIIYKMQRPGIAPSLVYPHDCWKRQFEPLLLAPLVVEAAPEIEIAAEALTPEAERLGGELLARLSKKEAEKVATRETVKLTTKETSKAATKDTAEVRSAAKESVANDATDPSTKDTMEDATSKPESRFERFTSKLEEKITDKTKGEHAIGVTKFIGENVAQTVGQDVGQDAMKKMSPGTRGEAAGTIISQGDSELVATAGVLGKGADGAVGGTSANHLPASHLPVDKVTRGSPIANLRKNMVEDPATVAPTRDTDAAVRLSSSAKESIAKVDDKDEERTAGTRGNHLPGDHKEAAGTVEASDVAVQSRAKGKQAKMLKVKEPKTMAIAEAPAAAADSGEA
ncbi:hypothetical protein FRB98_006489 [Tulasnella sp. 332]|nr:hypothetical protein FRB98_006489 [Tulasnella sp. 332]